MVGRMAKHDQMYAGLMQDVFQDESLCIYDKSDMTRRRKERLLRHALGSSTFLNPSEDDDGGVPNL